MDEAERAITNGNVDRFLDHLYSEDDPGIRALYHRILVKEESRFASLTERFEISTSRIHRCDARIAAHLELMKKHPGQNETIMLQGLENLRDTRRILADYQSSVRREMDGEQL